MRPIETIRQIVWNASSSILKHTIVIYSFIGKKHFIHCNGILFNHNQKSFIITAEHAFTNIQMGDLKIFRNGSFCFLEGTIIGHPVYDIALFELESNMASCLSEDYVFLEKESLLFNHRPEYKQNYLLVGYPTSKTVVKGLSIKEKLIVYHTTTLKIQPKSNEVLFSYNKRKSGKYDQKGFFFAPNPVGLSGSGLWYVEALSFDNIQYHLEGIFKEFEGKRNTGISTKIDCIKEQIN